MTPRTLQREEKYYKIVKQILDETPYGEQLIRHLDILNYKSAAALTHLSIMIATSAGIFIFWNSRAPGRIDEDIILLSLLAEIVGYIVLTCFALFACLITGPSAYKEADSHAARLKLMGIIRRRRIALLVSIYGTYLLTLALVATFTSEVLVR
jgi:hypothetical protein